MSAVAPSRPTGAPYICRYCRLPSDASGTSCPNCGAPVDIRAFVSDSGWVEQPPVRDMARVHFARSTCQVEGTLVPNADFALAEGDGVVFSHHTFLWCQPGTNLEPWSQGSFFNRTLAGMPMVLMRASGPGRVALSEDHPGEVVALPIPPGHGFLVREHSMLAMNDAVKFTWHTAPVQLYVRNGDETETEYPVGPFLDYFSADQGVPGLLLLHSAGNLFVRDLGPGQSILVQPSSWVYSDAGVNFDLHIEYPASGGLMFGSYNYRTVWLRLRGPGRVAVRSVFEKPERYAAIVGGTPMTSYQW